jgi:hypothetical protein
METACKKPTPGGYLVPLVGQSKKIPHLDQLLSTRKQWGLGANDY